MSILKYKYKAHKFINYAFYLVVFIFGFLLGFTTQKLDFNKLVSQFLMIDNVSAYTIYEDENVTIDKKFIQNKFIEFFGEQIDFNVHKNYIATKHGNVIAFILLDDNVVNNFYINSQFSNDSRYMIGYNPTPNSIIYNFNYYPSLNSYYHQIIPADDGFHNLTTIYRVDTDDYYSRTNFDLSFATYEENMLFNKLGINYKLNDGSIFEDENHQDFNKYCWDNFDELVFSITIDDSYDGSFNAYQEGQQDGETYIKSGFYVFDDISKLKRGTRIKALGSLDYEFDSSTWLGGLTFNHLQNIKTEFELLHTEENLGLRYSAITDALGNYDITRGDSYYYDNLDKLKNSSYVDFTYYFNVVDDFRYDVFYLKEEKENFCIYVPNVFIVTTLGLNELGGFVGDIPLHNDKNDSFIDVSETTGQLHFNQLFSIINKFINSIKDTVIFINDFIYSFFTALHPLIQMFIFTFITLLVVKLIIGMVVR